MKYYVVVEGVSTEPAVFKQWIPYLNPRLSHVAHPNYLVDESFTIVSGYGYPQYLQIVRDSTLDVLGLPAPTRLVVCIDAEDWTKEKRYEEVRCVVDEARAGTYIDYRIVVQHFCFEAWALGNRKIGPRNPQGADLKKYKAIHNVLEQDPELLPELPDEDLNRSQFAVRYLSRLFSDRNKGITYSKRNPAYVAAPQFLEQLITRQKETKHIDSFGDFVAAFTT